MPNRYHVDILAELYCISNSAIRKRAEKLGLKGSHFTADEAIRIGSNDGKLEARYIYPEDNIYPSKLNHSPTSKLPDWRKHTQTHTIITK